MSAPTPRQEIDLVTQVGNDAYRQFVKAVADVALAANTYANNNNGQGATLTGNSNGALAAIDGYTAAVGDRLLITAESTGSKNGVYTVTQVGSGGTPYILTRAADMETTGQFVGAVFTVANGTQYVGTEWVCSNTTAPTVGTTAITFEIRQLDPNEILSLYAVDSGSANAYVITITPGSTSYQAGQVFFFKASNANTGASTINVDSLGTKNITKFGTTTLDAGDIISGAVIMIQYDGTQFQMLSTPGADNVAALSWKTPVDFASTANVTGTYNSGNKTLTGLAVGALNMDGSSPAVGQRVLLKNQSTASQNGLYTVTVAGSGILAYILTRTADFDTSAEVDEASAVFVVSGSTLAATGWILTTSAPITLDTTSLTWAQFFGAGLYTAGTGLTLTGNQFSLTSPVTAALGGTGQTSYTKGDIIVASGSTTLTKQGVGSDKNPLTADSSQTNGVLWATNFFFDNTNKRLGVGVTPGSLNSIDVLTSDHDANVHFKTSASITSGQDAAMFYSDASTDGATFKFGLFGLSRSVITSNLTATIYTNAPNGFCIATNTSTLQFQIDANGNIVFGNAAIAQSATNGFPYIPTCTGKPSGTPTAYTGRAALVYDTTNHTLWKYDTILSAWVGDIMYTSTVGTQSTVSVTTSATQLLASNASRLGYSITNNGSVDIYLGNSSVVSGATAVSNGGEVVKANGGTYTPPTGSALYTGAIYGITATGTAIVGVKEFT